MTSPSSMPTTAVADAGDVLAALHPAGIAAWPYGDALLLLAPPGALAHDLRELLAAAKPDVLAHLESEVGWRVEGMAEQARDVAALGFWPFLVARSTPTSTGACLSCGEPLLALEKARCCLCQEAARRTVAAT